MMLHACADGLEDKAHFYQHVANLLGGGGGGGGEWGSFPVSSAEGLNSSCSFFISEFDENVGTNHC